MGEGGMINTNSKELFEKVILLRNHGILKRLEEKNQSENTVKNDLKKVGRNEKCPCGSGKKFKHCHGNV